MLLLDTWMGPLKNLIKLFELEKGFEYRACADLERLKIDDH